MSYLRLLRPHQYLKNLFLFLPLFFALKIFDLSAIVRLFLAFGGFSLLCSSIYILNDYLDREEDRLHPVKCRRPLAAGTVSPRGALVLALATLGIGLAIFSSFDSWTPLLLVLVYLLLNLAYSLGLKRMAIIDVNIIASGFILRLFIGGAVAKVELSAWIVMMTYLLALFLALGKRRDDQMILQRTGKKMRAAVDGYNLKFLDGAMIFMSAAIVVCYILYTVSPSIVARSGESLYLTSVFVVAGVLRYLQLAFVHQASGSPTRVLMRDLPLQLVLLLWVVSFAAIIYF